MNRPPKLVWPLPPAEYNRAEKSAWLTHTLAQMAQEVAEDPYGAMTVGGDFVLDTDPQSKSLRAVEERDA